MLRSKHQAVIYHNLLVLQWEQRKSGITEYINDRIHRRDTASKTTRCYFANFLCLQLLMGICAVLFIMLSFYSKNGRYSGSSGGIFNISRKVLRVRNLDTSLITSNAKITFAKARSALKCLVKLLSEVNPYRQKTNGVFLEVKTSVQCL